MVPRVSAIDDVVVRFRAIPHCLQKRGLDTYLLPLYAIFMKDQAAYAEAVKILERLREIKANIKTLEEERSKVWSRFHKQRSSIILSCERCGNKVPYGDAGLNRYSPAKTDPEPLEPDVHACYSRFDCKPCGHVNKVRRDPKLDISPW